MKKFDVTKVEYSRNDIKQGIKVPEELTEELAYFLGFHVGDGYMVIKKEIWKYRCQYDGHSVNDYLWYVQFLRPLVKRLFNLDVRVHTTINGTVRFYIRSKAIVTFLHRCCGLALSPKKEIGILSIVKSAGDEMQCHFLRGLADTDFSLVFKKKSRYPVIAHATYSKILNESVTLFLKTIEFHFRSATRLMNHYGKKFRTYEIEIYGRKNLDKWLELIGFSSYNTITRYLVWKELGYFIPRIDINERIKILKERGIQFPPERLGPDLNSPPLKIVLRKAGDLMVNSHPL